MRNAFAFALAAALAVPAVLDAQVAPPATPPAATPPGLPAVGQPEPPPSKLVNIELARSRNCVASIAMLSKLDEDLAPLFKRGERIQILNAAIALEDSARVAPFDLTDSIELAVRDWFVADWELAMKVVAGGGDAIQQQRNEARDRIRQRLEQALDPLRTEAQQRSTAAGNVDEAESLCQNSVFVRPAVVEACATVQSPICEPARTPEPDGPWGFVNSATDLWDLEQLRPWTDPVALSRTPDGGLAGARAAALTRRGNVLVIVGVEPLLRPRESLSAADVAELDANLDSMGIVFEDKRFAMSPVVTIQANMPEPLGDETHYVLHFGDMSNPVDDMIWSVPAPAKGPLEAVVPVPGWVLTALARGEQVTFSAIKSVEGKPAELVYALGITPIGQSRSVGAVLTYLTSGQLGRDLATVVPPAPGSGGR